MKHRLKEATFMMYINNKAFEWDEKKAAVNRIKHGVGFDQAAFSFDDPNALTIDDHKHSFLEQRHWLIGHNEECILVVVFTIRMTGKVRIISARKANNKERTWYEKNKGV